ncbi:MAG: ABC transporter permease [Clostridia bacterium]
MIKPLSPLKYFKENKKKTAVIFITLFLAVLCISIITCTFTSILATATEANIAPLREFSYISAPNGNMFIDETVITKISDMETTQSIYSVMIEYTLLKTIIGNTSSPIVFINDDENFKDVFKKTNLSLINGRMPKQDEYEIIMHSNVLTNKNLKVGDTFGNEVDSNEMIGGTYTIVGEFIGDSIMGFGSKNFYLNSLQNSGIDTDNYTLGAVIFPKIGDLEAMNSNLETLDKTEASITTKTIVLKLFDEQTDSLNSILTLLILIITFGMSVSVGALIYTFYNARNNEFGILYAIGYSKKDVKKLIYKEILFISILSWFLGYFASIGVLKIIDIVLFKPLGQNAVLFSIYAISYTLIVPAFVFLCATIPIVRSLSKKDLVNVIERRG